MRNYIGFLYYRENQRLKEGSIKFEVHTSNFSRQSNFPYNIVKSQNKHISFQMASLLDFTEAAPLEQTLIQLRECFVYKTATTHSSRGFCAGDWGLDNPLATCTCIVKSRGEEAAIQLFDNKSKGQNNRKMLAQSVIVLDQEGDKSKIEWYCESVTDSSRYFVIKVQNPRDPTKIASLGIGFRQKESAYSFTAALQDHAKYVRRLRESNSNNAEGSSLTEPSKDMTLGGVLGDGGKIKINVKITKKKKKKKKKKKDKDKEEDVFGLMSSGMQSMKVQQEKQNVGEDQDFDDDDFGDFMS